MVFDFLRRAEVAVPDSAAADGAAAARAVPERKASATGPVVAAGATGGRVAAFGSSGRVVWSPRDGASLVKNGFLGNPVGFRAVKLIAEAAAALPLVLQDAERRYDGHPVLDLVRRPNPAQGRADLFEAAWCLRP